MDPASALSVASPVVQSAAEAAKRKLEAADQLAAQDARRYVSYLEAAQAAIKGLENEYTEILVEAMHCRLDQIDQRNHLSTRIQQHLYLEALRPILIDAVSRLETGRAALAEHAERVFQWPSVKQGRAAALTAYDQLLARLKSYVEQLGGWYQGAGMSPAMQAALKGQVLGGSCVNVVGLHVVLAYVTQGDQEKLAEHVGWMLGSMDSDRHLTMTRDVARVIETMLITFR